MNVYKELYYTMRLFKEIDLLAHFVWYFHSLHFIFFASLKIHHSQIRIKVQTIPVLYQVSEYYLEIMHIVLNAISSVLALISSVFFLIAIIAYSTEVTTVRNTAWFISENSGDVDIYVGLQQLVIEQSGASNQRVTYGNCAGNTCNVCERQGDRAFGLLVISVVFSFISLGLSLGGAVTPLIGISASNLVASFIASLFGVIGWSLFVDKCFRKISSETDQDFEFGPGSILSLIAFILMFIVFVLQVAVISREAHPSSGTSSTSTAQGTQKQSIAAIPTNEL